jgi:hypothetical protein
MMEAVRSSEISVSASNIILLTLPWISVNTYLAISFCPVPHPTYFNPEDGGSMLLGNICICLQDYTVSKPN